MTDTDTRLGRIEGKVDGLVDLLNDHAKHAKDAQDRAVLVSDKQDTRIRSLERFRNISIGVVAVVSSGAGVFWRYL